MDKKMNLHDLFHSLQRDLESKLHVGRETIKHPGTKGDASELNWIMMLKAYLPARYSVDKAFVLDSEGTISEQIDLVIYDRQYSPLLFNFSGALYIPAESAYAIFEIKQDLSKENIEYAQAKAGSVRRLKRTSVSIPHAGGRYQPKEPAAIIAGILCLESTWNPVLGEPFAGLITQCPEEQRLDLGCALRHGAFNITYGAASPDIEKSAGDTTLIFFFLRLLERLRQSATVPAMDLRQYGRFL